MSNVKLQNIMNNTFSGEVKIKKVSQYEKP
jgi:hypothetical protein